MRFSKEKHIVMVVIMREFDQILTNVLGKERDNLTNACENRLSLFETKIQLLMEKKKLCGCVEREVSTTL